MIILVIIAKFNAKQLHNVIIIPFEFYILLKYIINIDAIIEILHSLWNN